MPAAKLKKSLHFATWFTLFAVLAAGSPAVAVPWSMPTNGSSTAPASATIDVAGTGHEDQVSPELAGDTAVSPEPANELLGRLRGGFELPAIVNRRVTAELSWFVRHPDYLNRVFTRAQRYMPYIADEIEARGLPLDLALLPIIESAYDPFAYSHGRAAGLWQIIPGTARRFGIRQNW